LSAVLYGSETSSLALKEEQRLGAFENRVLKRTFGPKRDGVTRGYRKLHIKEPQNLYSSPTVIRIIKSERMRLAGNITRMRGRIHTAFLWEKQKRRDY
jgi:hypothetical protein